jgi:uncharacterized protein YbjT (DUF2867 family)
MHIILGGTGRVGSAVARSLIASGAAVTIVTRDPAKAAALRLAGAALAHANLRDPDRLREIFRTGRRAFLLNPPAAPSSDTDAEERATVAAILAALDRSGLEMVVAQSTYGARPGKRCGDLTVLHGLEEGLRRQSIPAVIHRGAYYMSNWTGWLDIVRRTGTLPSFLPTNLRLPMVAPEDLGHAAALRLLAPPQEAGLHHIEGPERYSPQDVAEAFAAALGAPVEAAPIPPERWEATFRDFGFSEAAARSYACMTGAVVDGQIEAPAAPIRGTTSISDYVASIVAGS